MAKRLGYLLAMKEKALGVLEKGDIKEVICHPSEEGVGYIKDRIYRYAFIESHIEVGDVSVFKTKKEALVAKRKL